MDNEAAQTLEKKLRRIFRKKKNQNRCLDSKGNRFQLVTRLPLDAYQELEKGLTDDEFYEFKSAFESYEDQPKDLLFSIFSIDVWFERCCSDSRLFDSLSDEQLEKILNDPKWHPMTCLFFETGQNPVRQYRIMKLLNEEILEYWMQRFSNEEEFSGINSFLVWLCQKKKDEESFSEQEVAEIFQKIASCSDSTIAKLLENVQACVVKRILQQVEQMERDTFLIYQQIHYSNVYNVLKKSDFKLLDNAEPSVYSWVYEHIAEEDEEDFLSYLANEKMEDLELFNAKICAGIYRALWESNHPDQLDFAKHVFTRKGRKAFGDFYELLSLEEKEEMFELFLEDKEGRDLIELFLESKKEEDLSLLERLVKEKYVTKK